MKIGIHLCSRSVPFYFCFVFVAFCIYLKYAWSQMALSYWLWNATREALWSVISQRVARARKPFQIGKCILSLQTRLQRQSSILVQTFLFIIVFNLTYDNSTSIYLRLHVCSKGSWLLRTKCLKQIALLSTGLDISLRDNKN